MTGQLSTADMEILAFERTGFRGKTGPKDAAILTRFGDTPTRYYQRLHTILTKPSALAYDPELVHRLTRQKTAARAVRAAQPRGTE